MINLISTYLLDTYNLGVLSNNRLPKEIMSRIEKYVETYYKLSPFYDTELDSEEICEHFEECYPEVEYLLKDFRYGLTN